MELPGMFITEFPVCLRRNETLADCQTKLLSSISRLNAGEFLDLAYNTRREKHQIVLDVQNFYYGCEGIIREIKLVELSETPQQNFELVTHPVRVLKNLADCCVFVTAGKQITCTVISDNSYSADFVRKLSQNFIKELRAILKGE